MKKLIFIIIGIAVLSSCNNGKDPQALNHESVQEQAMAKEAAMPAANEKTAIVLEAIDAGTYTYLRLEADGKDFWAAINARPVEIGKTYYYVESVWMKNFESKQLKRTFDSILFIGYFGEQSQHTGNTAMPAATQGQSDASKEGDIKITHKGEEISLAELFVNKEKYSGKQATVKGKVVKINRNIMNQNWIHIQDGTSYEGQFDLTITMKDPVKFNLDDVVSFQGTIALDKDFGAGYVYAIIMESAAVLEQ